MMETVHYFLKIHRLNDSSKNESADDSIMSIIVSYSLGFTVQAVVVTGVCSRNKQGSSRKMAKDKAAATKHCLTARNALDISLLQIVNVAVKLALSVCTNSQACFAQSYTSWFWY